MTQRLGPLASLILVVSGGASCARARRRASPQMSPAVAAAPPAKRKSRLVGNIDASRFAEPLAFHEEPLRHREIFRDALFDITLSESELQLRYGIRSRRTTFCETPQIPSSLLTSLMNRQSVPAAMILSGDDL